MIGQEGHEVMVLHGTGDKLKQLKETLAAKNDIGLSCVGKWAGNY